MAQPATVTPDVLDAVTETVVRVLGIEDRAAELDADTALFGSMPELDSLAVVELAAALEDRFDLVIDDADFSADTFETLGTLATFVAERTAG